MKGDFSLVVEAWRGLAHSYALVNQYQCLEMLKMPGVRLYHRDVPFYGEHWRESKGLFSEEIEARIAAIPAPPGDLAPDATLRIAYPYNFAPVAAGRLFVFGTAENMACPRGSVVGAGDGTIRAALESSGATLITPSNWSKEGFVRSGAPAERIVVVPHGVDTGLLHPATPEERRALRVALGLSPEEFVFLNVGSLMPNKGALLLIKTFAEVARRHPAARLILKFNGALYSSRDFMESANKMLTPAEQAVVGSRVRLFGEQHSLAAMAILYRASDAYVAPYHAEGFNMPALEACACGLPVICTAGGPTDEFLPEGVLMAVSSSRQTIEKPGESLIVLRPDGESLLRRMTACISDDAVRRRAAEVGPRHVATRYTWGAVAERLVALMRE